MKHSKSQVKYTKDRGIMHCAAFSVDHRQRSCLAVALLAAFPGVLTDAFVSECVTLCTCREKTF